MQIGTAQISRWKNKPDGLDITRKSAVGSALLFAPTWDMVMKIKRAAPEMVAAYQVEYMRLYRALLDKHFDHHPQVFTDVLQREQVILLCYCRPNTFCHRHLLLNYLEELALIKQMPFTRLGEMGITHQIVLETLEQPSLF